MDDETERNRYTRNSDVTIGTNYNVERWNFNGRDTLTVQVFEMSTASPSFVHIPYIVEVFLGG